MIVDGLPRDWRSQLKDSKLYANQAIAASRTLWRMRVTSLE